MQEPRIKIQGYSKRSTHFQEFILQVLQNMRWSAICRLKGELSKLFSHLTSTRCEPHVCRGRCPIDNQALPTLVPVADFLGGFFPQRVRKCRCTLDNDVVFANSSTQKVFSSALAAILNITPLAIQNYCVRTWHLAGDSDQNFERFIFHPHTGHGSSVSSFCKPNFWKWKLLFE
jgi:hypothetical protein